MIQSLNISVKSHKLTEIAGELDDIGADGFGGIEVAHSDCTARPWRGKLMEPKHFETFSAS